MMAMLALGVSLVLPSVQLTDTTIAVRRGTRLDVETRSGPIHVTTWARNEVAISVMASGGAFAVETSPSVIRVRPERGRWRRRAAGSRDRYEWNDLSDEDVGFQIRIPVYVPLTLKTLDAEIIVRGTQAEIVAESTEGDISVTGGARSVLAATVDGIVRVTGSRGRVEAVSGDGDVIVSDIVGEIDIETIDGNISISEANSRHVRASTVDGNVSYAGSIVEGGRYDLSTHDGDITLVVPDNVSADVTVANFNGGFETSFPVTLRESQRKRLRFTLGAGGAQVRLEAFDGDVFLRRRSN